MQSRIEAHFTLSNPYFHFFKAGAVFTSTLVSYWLLSSLSAQVAASKESNDQVPHSLKRALGDEFRVNPKNGGYTSVAVADRDGNYFVAWRPGPMSTSADFFLRKFDATGNPLSNATIASIDTVYPKNYPAIDRLINGGVVLTWTSNSIYGSGLDGNESGIFARGFDAQLNPLFDDIQVNTYTNGRQYFSDVACLKKSEGFVVVWVSSDQEGDGSGIYAQRFNQAGNKTGLEYRVNSNITGNQGAPAIASTYAGGYVIVWNTLINYYGYQLWLQQYDENDNPLGSEVLVGEKIGQYKSPGVAVFSNDAYVLCWESYNDSDGPSVALRSYLNLISLSDEKIANSYTVDSQGSPTIDIVGDDTFAIAWESNKQNGDATEIYMQRFTNNLSFIGTEIHVNDFTNKSQTYPSLAGSGNGGLLITWSSNGQTINEDYDVYAKVYGIPRFITNNFPCQEGGTLILDSSMLQAVSFTTSNDSINFIMTNITHGIFAEIIDTNKSISTFSQLQVSEKQIVFIQDGTEFAPMFSMFAESGKMISLPEWANITFSNKDDLPILEVNQLSISEGATVGISSFNLKANDVETATEFLVFKISESSFGYFSRVNDSSVTICEFQQQEILSGQIQFIHDGSNHAPIYKVAVYDGSSQTQPELAIVTFFPVNDKPELEVAQIVIHQGEALLLNSSHLYATDEESSPANISYQIINLAHATFSSVDGPKTAIVTFTQNDIDVAHIQLVHDNSELPPNFGIYLSDGTGGLSGPFTVTINFQNKGNLTIEENNNSSTVTQIAIPASIGAVCLGGLLTAGIWYRNYAKDKKTRKQHPFAEFVRQEIQLSGLGNFESAKGIYFVSIINKMSKEFAEQGTPLDSKDENELKLIAKQVAESARNKLTHSKTCLGYSEITLRDLDQKISDIVDEVLNMRVSQTVISL